MNQPSIIEQFFNFISSDDFPCVIARHAVSKNNIKVMQAGHLACPSDDLAILKFIYQFIHDFRKSGNSYNSVAIIFNTPTHVNEEEFEQIMWMRLQSLRDMDAKEYKHDSRVSNDPTSADFSFSLMEEAFFVLAMHPGSSRSSRKFSYPVLIFNPHEQFEEMKAKGMYDKVKAIVRKRDLAYSGSVNPMLSDFGEDSEALQYSGKFHDKEWQCPLNKK